MLVEEGPSTSPYIHIIRKCKTLINRPEWEVTITHCYREANRVADWLANYGVNADLTVVIFEAVPMDLKAVKLEDIGGMTTSRLVPIAAG